MQEINLSRDILIGTGEALHVLLNETVTTQELDVGTIGLDLALLAKLDVVLAADGGETPVLGDDDLLATREFVHGAAESLDSSGTVGVTGTDGQKDLADVDTSNGTLGLTERTTHTGLETIGTGARQHLVDTDDVEGVGADTEVETFLTGDLHEVLVGANTSGFKSLGRKLFVLVGDEVNAQRKVISAGLLTSQIVDTDLRIGNTTVEPGLGVGLFIRMSSVCFFFLFPSLKTLEEIPTRHGCIGSFRVCDDEKPNRDLGRPQPKGRPTHTQDRKIHQRTGHSSRTLFLQ